MPKSIPYVPTIRQFKSTRLAYDMSQRSEDIEFGDVLLVPSEKVVGILFEAWPCAITKEQGAFDRLASDEDWHSISNGLYVVSYAVAVALALEPTISLWSGDR